SPNPFAPTPLPDAPDAGGRAGAPEDCRSFSSAMVCALLSVQLRLDHGGPRRLKPDAPRPALVTAAPLSCASRRPINPAPARPQSPQPIPPHKIASNPVNTPVAIQPKNQRFTEQNPTSPVLQRQFFKERPSRHHAAHCPARNSRGFPMFHREN